MGNPVSSFVMDLPNDLEKVVDGLLGMFLHSRGIVRETSGEDIQALRSYDLYYSESDGKYVIVQHGSELIKLQ